MGCIYIFRVALEKAFQEVYIKKNQYYSNCIKNLAKNKKFKYNS